MPLAGIKFANRDKTDFALAMLDWLTGNCDLFGLPGQNWMLVIGGGLLLYSVTMLAARWRQGGARKQT